MWSLGVSIDKYTFSEYIYMWLSQWVMTLISAFLNIFFGRLSKMALKIHNGNYAVFPQALS